MARVRPGLRQPAVGLHLWTAFGSVFALLLGYSRIPYAAALDGTFFPVFGKLHPTQHVPHVALLTVGLLAMIGSTLSLGIVIDALVTMRPRPGSAFGVRRSAFGVHS